MWCAQKLTGNSLEVVDYETSHKKVIVSECGFGEILGLYRTRGEYEIIKVTPLLYDLYKSVEFKKINDKGTAGINLFMADKFNFIFFHLSEGYCTFFDLYHEFKGRDRVTLVIPDLNTACTYELIFHPEFEDLYNKYSILKAKERILNVVCKGL